jgi:hypothetical protein
MFLNILCAYCNSQASGGGWKRITEKINYLITNTNLEYCRSAFILLFSVSLTTIYYITDGFELMAYCRLDMTALTQWRELLLQKLLVAQLGRELPTF